MVSTQSYIAPPLYFVRGRQVILDSDLSSLFGVSTKRLNEQVRRNSKRFPLEFAFRVSPSEAHSLRSQIATSNIGRGGRRNHPLAFTEHGVVMAANVLNSEKAVSMSVEIVKSFVRLRKALRSDRILGRKLAELEAAVKNRLERHDADIDQLFKTVESLLDGGEEESKQRKRIGFVHPGS